MDDQRRVLDSQRRMAQQCRKEQQVEREKEKEEVRMVAKAFEAHTLQEYEQKKQSQAAIRMMFAEQVLQADDSMPR